MEELKNMNTYEKNLVINLYNLLVERTNKSKEVLDILDVLSQVNKRLDKEMTLSQVFRVTNVEF